jgi:hypothetical protein
MILEKVEDLDLDLARVTVSKKNVNVQAPQKAEGPAVTYRYF